MSELYLCHRSHKYIDRYKGKRGKWVYIYKRAKSKSPKFSSGGFNEGDRNRQKWQSIETNDGHEFTTLSGSNSANRYAGISVGKRAESRDDYDFVDKSVKVGGVEVNYNNDEGLHNVTIHLDHDTIDKGKKKVQKLLGI